MSRDMASAGLASQASLLVARPNSGALTDERRVNQRRLPRALRVLVFEDGDSDAQDIREVLTEAGAECEVVSDLESLEDRVQMEAYDVASIDWDIRGVMHGADALTMLGELDRDMGKVVLSVHAYKRGVREWAQNSGADFVVEKRAGNFHEYLDRIQQAARKSFFRRITRCLREVKSQAGGEADVKSPASFDAADFDAAESSLYLEAKQAVIAAFLAGEEDGELMRHMERRGWWARFDSGRFLDLPFEEKVAKLLHYVRVTSGQLAKILDVDEHVAEAVLRGNEIEHEFGVEVAENLDKLSSVLSYLLRLSRYKPDMMHYFWTVKNLHAGSHNPPPWNETGLAEYLEQHGVRGLQEALIWIRSY
jgi:CheY-like chemotaxis protein